VLRNLGGVPAFLVDREHVLGLRLELEPRDLVGVLAGIVTDQRQPLLVDGRMKSDLD
jgi:hypothetical protein